MVALFLWLICLVALLRFDPAKDSKTSVALWVPVTWMFIIGSRLPTQWVGGQVGIAAEAFEEGSALDRSVYFGLILLAVGILMSRSFKWEDFFSRNLALVVFVSFALVSVAWSDSPFVSLKRWFRDLGNYLMILVVLSDPRPLEAVRGLLRRLAYLLIPLSILLVKYYPTLGAHYNPWTGAEEFVGASTSKNVLGMVCMVSALFFFWDTIMRWANRRTRQARRIILVNTACLAMTLWLMYRANSATSRVCLLIGCLVILAARTKAVKRRPALLNLIPAGFCLYLILAFGLGFMGEFAGAVGRDPTLTDRTNVWATLLSLHTNPLVGTGYDSFWLGPRLQWLWQQKATAGLNEAHNGYLEIYLNLGLIGLLLIGGLIIASYRSICAQLRSHSILASLSLALWTVTLFYNVSEAAFRWHLMWFTFLLGAITVANPFGIRRAVEERETQRVPKAERGTAGGQAGSQSLPVSARRM